MLSLMFQVNAAVASFPSKMPQALSSLSLLLCCSQQFYNQCTVLRCRSERLPDLTNQLIEQSPFSEANSCLPSKEISYLEWNMKVDCTVVKQVFVYYTTNHILGNSKEKYRPQYSTTVWSLHFVVVYQSTF